MISYSKTLIWVELAPLSSTLDVVGFGKMLLYNWIVTLILIVHSTIQRGLIVVSRRILRFFCIILLKLLWTAR